MIIPSPPSHPIPQNLCHCRILIYRVPWGRNVWYHTLVTSNARLFQRGPKGIYNEGDYQKAGDYYALAGDIQSAIDSYTTGGHYAVAARLLEKSDDIRRAAQYYAQASIFDKAATLYLRVEDYRNASLTFEKSGDFTRAADMAAKSEDFARAAMMAEQANQLDKAAQYYNQVQNYERAAEIYEKLLIKHIRERTSEGEFLESVHNAIKKFGNNAGNLYFRLKQYDKAAKCFEDAANYAKCAEAHSQLEI